MSTYLNLGCGSLLMKNAINVDSSSPNNLSEEYVFVKEDVIQYLKKCNREQFSKVFMFYFLEHLDYQQVTYLTYLLNHVLKMGGEVIGVTEDFDEICQQYLNYKNRILAIESFRYNVLSDGIVETVHKSLWNKELLTLYFGIDGFHLFDLQQRVGSRNVGMFFKFKKIVRVGIDPKLTEV